MTQMIIMLENEDTRYEFYMMGIKRSNIDNTIVRYELRYNRIHNMTFGSEVSHCRSLVGDTFESFVNKLLLKGFKEVTYQTKKFA